MSRKKIMRGRVPLYLIGAGMLLITAGCSGGKKEKVESVADIQKREGIPVTVVVATPGTFELCERAGGTVEGYQQSVMTAAIPATVGAVNVQVGGAVSSGAEMIRLTPLSSSGVAIAQANYENIEKSLTRVKTLADQGAVSQDMLDQSVAGSAVARANLDGAMKAERITAPFAGMVVEVYQTPGAVVAPGAKLVKVATLGKARVKLLVNGDIVGRFKKGQRATAVVDGDTAIGTIEKVGLAGDESNHNFTVEAVFANEQKKLLPGMYTSVDVVVNRSNDVVTVPMEALVSEGAQKYAFLVQGGVAKKVPLVLGSRSGLAYAVTSGIVAGDSVVISGQSLLADDARVKLVR